MPSKGASLLPQDFSAGGSVPDGDYLMKEVKTDLFTYGQGGVTVPALAVTFVDGDGTEYEQHYSAGKTEFLQPSDDGKRFVHPSGGDAKITKNSNCGLFLSSLITGGFPTAGLSDDVSVFGGHRVKIVSKAQPKRGMENEKEKAIPLVEKYLGESKGKSAHGAAKAHATTPTPTTAANTASSTNGSLDDKAQASIKSILATAPDKTLTVGKLSTQVMLSLSKAKDPDYSEVKKLAGNPEWLMAHAEAGGWVSDGETVVLSE